METLPTVVTLIVLAGLSGTTVSICAMLWRGAISADIASSTATRVAAALAVAWSAWAVTSALLANAHVYRFAPTKPLPWLPVAMLVPFAVTLLCSRIPMVARVLARPDALWRLTMPQTFRAVGIAFLVVMAYGRLPAVFAIPAGLGDIAICIEAAVLTRSLPRGARRLRALWFNVLGLADLVVALGIGYAAAPRVTTRLLSVDPSTQAITLLPVVLIPTAIVPLAAALHVLSLRRLRIPTIPDDADESVGTAR